MSEFSVGVQPSGCLRRNESSRFRRRRGRASPTRPDQNDRHFAVVSQPKCHADFGEPRFVRRFRQTKLNRPAVTTASVPATSTAINTPLGHYPNFDFTRNAKLRSPFADADAVVRIAREVLGDRPSRFGLGRTWAGRAVGHPVDAVRARAASARLGAERRDHQGHHQRGQCRGGGEWERVRSGSLFVTVRSPKGVAPPRR